MTSILCGDELHHIFSFACEGGHDIARLELVNREWCHLLNDSPAALSLLQNTLLKRILSSERKYYMNKVNEWTIAGVTRDKLANITRRQYRWLIAKAPQLTVSSYDSILAKQIRDSPCNLSAFETMRLTFHIRRFGYKIHQYSQEIWDRNLELLLTNYELFSEQCTSALDSVLWNKGFDFVVPRELQKRLFSLSETVSGSVPVGQMVKIYLNSFQLNFDPDYHNYLLRSAPTPKLRYLIDIFSMLTAKEVLTLAPLSADVLNRYQLDEPFLLNLQVYAGKFGDLGYIVKLDQWKLAPQQVLLALRKIVIDSTRGQVIADQKTCYEILCRLLGTRDQNDQLIQWIIDLYSSAKADNQYTDIDIYKPLDNLINADPLNKYRKAVRLVQAGFVPSDTCLGKILTDDHLVYLHTIVKELDLRHVAYEFKEEYCKTAVLLILSQKIEPRFIVEKLEMLFSITKYRLDSDRNSCNHSDTMNKCLQNIMRNVERVSKEVLLRGILLLLKQGACIFLQDLFWNSHLKVLHTVVALLSSDLLLQQMSRDLEEESEVLSRIVTSMHTIADFKHTFGSVKTIIQLFKINLGEIYFGDKTPLIALVKQCLTIPGISSSDITRIIDDFCDLGDSKDRLCRQQLPLLYYISIHPNNNELVHGLIRQIGHRESAEKVIPMLEVQNCNAFRISFLQKTFRLTVTQQPADQAHKQPDTTISKQPDTSNQVNSEVLPEWRRRLLQNKSNSTETENSSKVHSTPSVAKTDFSVQSSDTMPEWKLRLLEKKKNAKPPATQVATTVQEDSTSEWKRKALDMQYKRSLNLL